jgi:hypothetical protein
MNKPAARSDPGTAVLTVRVYGSGPRTGLEALATVSSHLQRTAIKA